MDLTYVGRARLQQALDLRQAPAVAGVVFSLSKVMGAYQLRAGKPLPSGGGWKRGLLLMVVFR